MFPKSKRSLQKNQIKGFDPNRAKAIANMKSSICEFFMCKLFEPSKQIGSKKKGFYFEIFLMRFKCGQTVNSHSHSGVVFIILFSRACDVISEDDFAIPIVNKVIFQRAYVIIYSKKNVPLTISTLEKKPLHKFNDLNRTQFLLIYRKNKFTSLFFFICSIEYIFVLHNYIKNADAYSNIYEHVNIFTNR